MIDVLYHLQLDVNFSKFLNGNHMILYHYYAENGGSKYCYSLANIFVCKNDLRLKLEASKSSYMGIVWHIYMGTGKGVKKRSRVVMASKSTSVE